MKKEESVTLLLTRGTKHMRVRKANRIKEGTRVSSITNRNPPTSSSACRI